MNNKDRSLKAWNNFQELKSLISSFGANSLNGSSSNETFCLSYVISSFSEEVSNLGFARNFSTQVYYWPR